MSLTTYPTNGVHNQGVIQSITVGHRLADSFSLLTDVFLGDVTGAESGLFRYSSLN
jgi:hypothetical protein